MRSLVGRLLNRATVPLASQHNTPLSGIGAIGAGDAESQLAAYGSVGTLFAIVNRLASSTAQVEWKLYRNSSDARRVYGPDEMKSREVTSHPALSVWNKPNPFYPRQEFVESAQQHVDLTGECWWFVDRVGDRPVELWPIRPDKMAPVVGPRGPVGYTYKGPRGEKIPLELNEVIQIRMPNPLDAWRGMGPVQTLLADIGAAKAAAEWNRNFFSNSARPGGIVQYDRNLDDVEFREQVERWREQHQGVRNAHRVAVLEGGAKWIDASYSQKDMEFTELRKLSSEVIREAFAFPKPMLGSVDDVNRANAEAGEYVFARWMLKDRLERFKAALNNDFLPMFGDLSKGYEFDYCNPVPEDSTQLNAERTSKANAAETYINAGFAPDEVLAALGLPEMTYVGRRDAAPTAGERDEESA